MNNITCLGDFCILVEDCPFYESCVILVEEMRLKEEWVKEHPGEPPFKD
jgi:hypothetical protein